MFSWVNRGLHFILDAVREISLNEKFHSKKPVNMPEAFTPKCYMILLNNLLIRSQLFCIILQNRYDFFFPEELENEGKHQENSESFHHS